MSKFAILKHFPLNSLELSIVLSSLCALEPSLPFVLLSFHFYSVAFFFGENLTETFSRFLQLSSSSADIFLVAVR